jgi:hypothetical protein
MFFYEEQLTFKNRFLMVTSIGPNQPAPESHESPKQIGGLSGRQVNLVGQSDSKATQVAQTIIASPNSSNSDTISIAAKRTSEFEGIDQLLIKSGVAGATYSSATFGIGSNIVGRTPGNPSTMHHLLQSANLTKDDVGDYEVLLLRNSSLEEKFMACKYLVGIKESKEALSELLKQDPLDTQKIKLHEEKIETMKKFLEFLINVIPRLDENPQSPQYLRSVDAKDYFVTIDEAKEIKVSKDMYENEETRSGMLAKQASFKFPCSPARWMDCSLNVMGQLLVDKFTHLKNCRTGLYNKFKDNVVQNKAIENNKHDDFYGVKDYYLNGSARYPSVDNLDKFKDDKYAKLLEDKPKDMTIIDWIGYKTYVGQNIQGKLMDYVIAAIESQEDPSLYLVGISSTIKELPQIHQKKTN